MAAAALGLHDCDTFALRKVRSLRLLAEAEALERYDWSCPGLVPVSFEQCLL